VVGVSGGLYRSFFFLLLARLPRRDVGWDPARKRGGGRGRLFLESRARARLDASFPHPNVGPGGIMPGRGGFDRKGGPLGEGLPKLAAYFVYRSGSE
jgi:hypothetical protein